jgi:hypothetical protein
MTYFTLKAVVKVERVLLTFSFSLSLNPVSIVDDALMVNFAFSVELGFSKLSDVIAALDAMNDLWLLFYIRIGILSILLRSFFKDLIYAVIEIKQSLLCFYLAFLEISLVVGFVSVNSYSTAMRKAFKPLPLVVAIEIFEVVHRAMLYHVDHSWEI